MKKKNRYIFKFENKFQKSQFLKAIGDINEQDLSKMCGIHIYKSSLLTGKLYSKIREGKLSLELNKEELRCLAIYFGRNSNELSPLSPVHRNFLLLARNAGFEVQKPIWEKPKNAVKFTDEELLVLKKLFKNAGWRNFLLDIHTSSEKENLAAKSFWEKINLLIEKMEEGKSG